MYKKSLTKSSKSKLGAARKQQPKNPRMNVSSVSVRCVKDMPYCDSFILGSSFSTSVTSFNILDALGSSTGLLQAFPQHSTPVTYNNAGTVAYRLRTKIVIDFIEFDFRMIGSQSTTLVAADLYNTIRWALYLEGPQSGVGSSLSYLTSVIGGTIIQDKMKVYHDQQYPLVSQAFDTVNSDNVPNVKTGFLKFPIHESFTFFSTTTTGVGAPWLSADKTIVLDVVSDSSIIPSPTFGYNARIFFRFM
jgi:hypothetical protein